VFGRCPVYVIVDSDTMAFQAVPNQAASAAGGAGIQAAQDVVNRGAKAVVTGNIGPNAYSVLAAAGVAVHVFGGGTVRQAVEAYRAGQVSSVSSPTGPAHGGMGMMRGTGMGRGMGGRGSSMGRGMGGQGGSGIMPASPLQAAPQPAAAPSPPADDIGALRAEVAELRERLGRLSDRIQEHGSR
jgi:predicted Fe-Mo cluster-binding NifX family protein